jgi:hypothetical protein
MASSPGIAVRWPRRAGVGLLVALLAAAGLNAQEPPAGAPAKAPAESAKGGVNRSLDGLKLPPGAVIIITDKPADALQNVSAVVLSPEEYRELVEAAEQGRRPDSEKAGLPSACRLSGKVEARGSGEVAVFQARFQFRTATPNEQVRLGLQNAKPTAAMLDGETPAALVPDPMDEGFAVRVGAAGEHGLRLDLEVPVTARGPRGAERGFDLGLAGAAITILERLELPAGVDRARVAGRAVPARQLAPVDAATPALVLGPENRLDVAWDAPSSPSPEDAHTAVEGRIDVRIDEKTVTTRAWLTLKTLGAAVDDWRIEAPATADVVVDGPAGADGAVQVERPRDPKRPVWVVRRPASRDDLTVEVSHRAALAAPGVVRVSAFPVVGAARQSGTITVGGSANRRLVFRPRDDVRRREVADEASRDAVFTYRSLPPDGVPLEVDVQPVGGAVEVHLAQQLTLTERGWRWQGRFDLRPVRTEATGLALDVPDELGELRAASADVVESIVPGRDRVAGRRLVNVQFADARRRPFSFTLEGLYPLATAAGSAALPMPRPLDVLDRGGQLTATVPAGLELRGGYREWDGDRAGDWERPLDVGPRGTTGLTAAVDRAPARVDLLWRSPRSEAAVAAVVEVTFGERQSAVRQRWRLPGGPDATRPLVARSPASLAGRLRAVDGGTLTAGGAGEWQVQLAPSAGREHEFAVAYSFPLPPAGERDAVDVPLVWLDAFPRCDTEVRVWGPISSAGVVLPVLAGGPWTEAPPAAVPDQPSLPVLTLVGTGVGLPLRLRLDEAGRGVGGHLLIERGWGQALADDDGMQAYRVRYRLRPGQAGGLEVELPAPPAEIQFDALLDGTRVPWRSPDTSGVPSRVVRLPVESAAGGAVRVLELSYVLTPGRADVPHGSRWGSALYPPVPRGAVAVGPVRWQVVRPSGDLVFATDGFEIAERWRWQRGLWTAVPAWGAEELGRWFGGPEWAAAEPDAGGGDAYVGRQTAAGPVRFVAVPRPVALLAASLAAVALGLAAVWSGGPRLWLAGGAVLAAAGLCASLVWPRPVAQVLAASQPGWVVLAGVLAARWVMLHRYRRRVLFLPGFTRVSANGSSLVRPGAQRPRGEPTTIDAPAPN